MAIVEIPAQPHPRGKHWAKTVTAVDTDLSNGYAFDGSWLDRGEKAELDDGTLVLLRDQDVSAKGRLRSQRTWLTEVRSGGLIPVEDDEGPIATNSTGSSWALDIRDRVAAVLDSVSDHGGHNPLAAYSTDELRAELDRREEL